MHSRTQAMLPSSRGVGELARIEQLLIEGTKTSFQMIRIDGAGRSDICIESGRLAEPGCLGKVSPMVRGQNDRAGLIALRDDLEELVGLLAT
jgi:hypothetical protein